jgi:phosphoribosylamine--glycine ligase/phosphoribosylformylglycinamidine cyclo-ligase
MARHNIPTARYENFCDYEKAKEHLDTVPYKVVIKATGLAAGKGVILPSTAEEARAALKSIMSDKDFGSAGDEVVIEEHLEGQELSFLSFSDGSSIKTLSPGQDHKQIFDSDNGPNTGGMGCYAPSPIATPELIEEVHRTILQPTIDGMRKERMPFRGLLFSGLMITKDGPKTLEYNVRFGDPETQTMLPLMDGDLADIMLTCTEGCLDAVSMKTHSGYAATVVASAGGYPGPYVRGDHITFDAPPANTHVFHAGTELRTDARAQNHPQPPTLTTSGGRVIAATSTAESLKTAIDGAYEGMSTIHFANMYYRKDIGKKGLEALDTQAAQSKGNLTKCERLTYASAGVSIAAGDEFIRRIKPLVRSTARPVRLISRILVFTAIFGGFPFD